MYVRLAELKSLTITTFGIGVSAVPTRMEYKNEKLD